MAIVLPLSLMAGDSWEDSRQMLAKRYSDLILVSIAGHSPKDLSFSADTGMGECLVIGSKTYKASSRAIFVVLRQRPAYPLVGATIASQIHRLRKGGQLRRLEDGPLGGTKIHFGGDIVGEAIEAPIPPKGGWHLGRIADLSLAQTAYQIAQEQVAWLPAMNKADAVSLPITTVEKIGKLGFIDRDINGLNTNGEPRGPFDIVPLEPNCAPTYPVLWAHDAQRERTMQFGPDSQGVARTGKTSQDEQGLAAKREAVWKTASHLHLNRDFQFNAQSTGLLVFDILKGNRSAAL